MAQPLPSQHAKAHTGGEGSWVQVMLTMERPSSSSLTGCNRQEKFDILLKHAQHQREVLIEWIQSHNLADEVLRIGQPTSLNLLFVQCTPHAADQLAQVPGVVDVALEGTISPTHGNTLGSTFT